MAEDKKKVIWYTNWGTTFLKLSDKEAGKLIKQYCGYTLDQNPEAPDRLTELLFDPIRDTLKRDLVKYNTKRGINQANGKKGGRPKKTETNPEKANGLFNNPEKGVSVNDSVKVIDKDIKGKQFLKWFNNHKKKHTGKQGKFKVLTDTDLNNLKKVKAAYSGEDMAHAMEAMCDPKGWAVENNKVDPSHLLAIKNFNKYLNTEVKKSKYKNTSYKPM